MHELATEVGTRSGTAPTVESGRGLRRARLLAAVGIGGAVLAAVVIGALHLLPGTADISPISRTISEYALTDSGWAFNLGVVALAIGSLAVFAALISAGHAVRWSIGSVLGVLWAAALLVIVLFPKHNWAIGPSTNGQIHRVASIVAFLCLPVAVMLLTRRRSRTGSTADAGPSGRGAVRVLAGRAVAGLVLPAGRGDAAVADHADPVVPGRAVGAGRTWPGDL